MSKIIEFFNTKIHEMNVLSLSYAKFEMKDAPVKYSKLSGVDKSQYEIYCILWFNLLSEIFESGKKRNKTDGSWVNEIIYAPEIIIQHQDWLTNDKINEEAYSKEFINFVNSVINTYNFKPGIIYE